MLNASLRSQEQASAPNQAYPIFAAQVPSGNNSHPSVTRISSISQRRVSYIGKPDEIFQHRSCPLDPTRLTWLWWNWKERSAYLASSHRTSMACTMTLAITRNI